MLRLRTFLAQTQHCPAIEMLKRKTMRGHASVVCDRSRVSLTVNSGKPGVQLASVGIGWLGTVCENAPWSDRICHVAREFMARAR